MINHIESGIKTMGILLMLPSFFVTPLLSMAAYNFHMAKVVQHHPMAQEMLMYTVLLIGAASIVGLIGFLMFVFLKEISTMVFKTAPTTP